MTFLSPLGALLSQAAPPAQARPTAPQGSNEGSAGRGLHRVIFSHLDEDRVLQLDRMHEDGSGRTCGKLDASPSAAFAAGLADGVTARALQLGTNLDQAASADRTGRPRWRRVGLVLVSPSPLIASQIIAHLVLLQRRLPWCSVCMLSVQPSRPGSPLRSLRATPVVHRRRASPASHQRRVAAAAGERPPGWMLERQFRSASVRPGRGSQAR